MAGTITLESAKRKEMIWAGSWDNRLSVPGGTRNLLWDGGSFGGHDVDPVPLWDVRDVLAGIRMEHLAAGLEWRWDLGTLQQAADPGAPWVDLDVVSPWPVSAEGRAGFFRVKVPL